MGVSGGFYVTKPAALSAPGEYGNFVRVNQLRYLLESKPMRHELNGKSSFGCRSEIDSTRPKTYLTSCLTMNVVIVDVSHELVGDLVRPESLIAI